MKEYNLCREGDNIGVWFTANRQKDKEFVALFGLKGTKEQRNNSSLMILNKLPFVEIDMKQEYVFK